MEGKAPILIISARDDVVAALRDGIDLDMFEPTYVRTLDDAVKAGEETTFGIAIADLDHGTGAQGSQIMDGIRTHFSTVIRLLAGRQDEREKLIEAVYSGDAYMYLCVDAPSQEMAITMIHALCEHENLVEIRSLKQKMTYLKASWQTRYDELEMVSNHEMEELGVFKLILDTLPVPTIATTRDRKVVYANAEVRAAFPSLKSLQVGEPVDAHLPDFVLDQMVYCIDNDLSVSADPFDIDSATVHLRVFPVSDRRADLVVLLLQELYPTFSG